MPDRDVAAGAEVALITGAAGGIGAACVELLRSSGRRTAGIDLKPSDADLSLTVDVSDRQAVAGAVAEVVDRFGRIDLAVTAAGFYEDGVEATAITVPQWNRMLAVLLGGTVNTAAAVLPYMLDAGQGAIVAISSELALGGGSEDLHYVAAKGAVIGFARSLAVEVAGTGVEVNVVAPGPTDTPLLAQNSPWRAPEYLSTLPLGRLATPMEVAETVCYLATSRGVYCGEVLSPNSGAVI
ncbi:SDR family oxidoreductase [Streptomyces sp. NPDC002896]|uniref:SDR family NAD(P)-dependent oxidoreductase n=1 Tax=Streptomyces sp. NPDC002896 TaxID=3154438 RepID=UPI003330B0AD